MNIAIVTSNSAAYQALADITVPNKREYCERHGYTLVHLQREEASGYDHVEAVSRVLPEYDAAMWLGCDTVITNHNVRAEEFLPAGWDFTAAEDVYGLNADVFIVRNSAIGRQLMRVMLEKRPGENEQAAFEYFLNRNIYRSRWYAPPADDINAYLNHLYGRPCDFTGTWRPGAWILHLPGLPMDVRIQHAREHADSAYR